MTILTLDVGYRMTGWALWNSDQEKFFNSGLISSQPDESLKSVAAQNLRGVRMLAIALGKLVDRYHPYQIVAELPHGGARNARAATCMALAFATVVTISQVKGVPLFPVTPNEVKRLVEPNSKGNQAVDKKAVQRYVSAKFGQDLLPDSNSREHIADAMAALAVCLKKEITYE